MGLVAGGPFAGSAAIAVSASADALPCGVATAGCAGTGNLVACVDSYYASDRACGTAVAHPTGVVAALAGQTQLTCNS